MHIIIEFYKLGTTFLEKKLNNAPLFDFLLKGKT